MKIDPIETKFEDQDRQAAHSIAPTRTLHDYQQSSKGPPAAYGMLAVLAPYSRRIL
jgi:hypothetical protein